MSTYITDPRVIDIRWLLERDVEGDLGRRSTCGGQLDAIARGALVSGFGPGGEPGDRQVKAVERERRIRTAIDRMPKGDRRILLAAFTPRPTEEVRKLAGLDPEWASYGLAPRTDQAGLLVELMTLCASPALADAYDRAAPGVDAIDWLRALHVTARKRNKSGEGARVLLGRLAADAKARLSAALNAYDDARMGRRTRVKVEAPAYKHRRIRAHTVRRWYSLGQEVPAALGVSRTRAHALYAAGRFKTTRREGRGRTAAVLVADHCVEAAKANRRCGCNDDEERRAA